MGEHHGVQKYVGVESLKGLQVLNVEIGFAIFSVHFNCDYWVSTILTDFPPSRPIISTNTAVTLAYRICCIYPRGLK